MGYLKYIVCGCVAWIVGWGAAQGKSGPLPDVTVYECSAEEKSDIKDLMLTKLVDSKVHEMRRQNLDAASVMVGDVLVMKCGLIVAAYKDEDGNPDGGFQFYQVDADVAYIIDGKVVADRFGGVVSLEKQDLRNDLKESAANPNVPDEAPKRPPTGVFENI